MPTGLPFIGSSQSAPNRCPLHIRARSAAGSGRLANTTQTRLCPSPCARKTLDDSDIHGPLISAHRDRKDAFDVAVFRSRYRRRRPRDRDDTGLCTVISPANDPGPDSRRAMSGSRLFLSAISARPIGSRRSRVRPGKRPPCRHRTLPRAIPASTDAAPAPRWRPRTCRPRWRAARCPRIPAAVAELTALKPARGARGPCPRGSSEPATPTSPGRSEAPHRSGAGPHKSLVRTR